MQAWRNFVFIVAALVIALLAAIACFNAAPSECIEAAEEAGFPDKVIEQLRNPGDLNAIERAALNRALSQAGIDDVCGVASDAASSGNVPDVTRQSNSDAGDDSEGDEPEKVDDRDEPTRQTISAQSSARIPEDDEHRRRCRFWALNNLEPVVYAEFSKLDPASMDDLDRILWRTKLNPDGYLGYYDDDSVGGVDVPPLLPSNPGIYCREYWAEPLNRDNAELRNHGFETECRGRLEERIINRYQRLSETLNYQEDNDLAYQTPNQYVRILQWLDMSGGELLNSGSPPYLILQQQSQHLYAYFGDLVPDEDSLAEYHLETDDRMNLEWLGILAAAGITDNSSRISACLYYYPQLFYGYWIPFDPDRMTDSNRELGIELPKYDGETMPLYLPKSVSAERIREGYPLGRTADGYRLCGDYYRDTELVGYYYVEHPAGNYCEKIP